MFTSYTALILVLPQFIHLQQLHDLTSHTHANMLSTQVTQLLSEVGGSTWSAGWPSASSSGFQAIRASMFA
jgi:hypothetical protein